jgi:tripartite-type tricarboxylate transporter receptor subunit TctC
LALPIPEQQKQLIRLELKEVVMRHFHPYTIVGSIVTSLLLVALSAGAASSKTPFYQGKTITFIVGAGPGGMGDLRAKALSSVLVKHIPGNPTVTFQYMPGAGGRKAANHFYNNVRADGLTLLRVASSIVPYAVLGESGVQYDIDKFIYLGTTEHVLYYLFTTRKEVALNSLDKLRAASGVRIGSSPVGHTGYIQSRVVAYLLDMKEPKIIPGYETQDLDIAFARGEVDARVASTGTVVQQELVTKNLADFHASIEIPKGQKDPRFVHLGLRDIDEFTRSEREKKLLTMMRGFRSIGTILMFPPGIPKDRVEILKEAVRKTHTDPEFIAAYRKMTGGDDPTPLMPEEQERVIKEIPRDPETIELFKKFAGTGPLPPPRSPKWPSA